MRGGRAAPGVSAEIVDAIASALGVAAPRAVDGFVPGEAADALIDGAAVRTSDASIGLTLASRIPMGGLGMLDYALCTSKSVRDAVDRVARHYGMVSQRIRASLEETPPRAALVLARVSGVRHDRHWIEFSFAAIASRVRQTTGRAVRPLAVSFAHASPGATEPYERVFGGPVTFDAPEDRLELSTAILDLPLLTAVASLADLLETRMRELDPAPADDVVLGRVRRVVAEALDGGKPTDVASLAVRLKTSPRTLQRQLREKRASLSAVIDDARRERALALLSGARLSMTQIAMRLGFDDPSAFFRAFRRWTGTTPTVYRRTRAAKR